MTKKRAQGIEELKPVYMLYGDEEYLANEALGRLKGMFESEESGGLNMEVFDAREAGATRIVEVAEVTPMMSDRRLVIARGFEKLSKSEQEKIGDYVQDPNDKTVLVLVTYFTQPGETRDANNIKKIESSALYKQVKQSGETLKFAYVKKGRQNKIEPWIRSEFKSRGKKITDGAISVLTERVGTELRDLSNTIEQVCLYSGDVELISEDMISETVYQAASHGVFELVDAVAERRRDLALLILNRLVKQGENPQNLLNLLLRQFRIIARVKSLDKTYDQREIASIVGVPPFLVYKCENQAKRYSSEKLREVFTEFRDAQSEMHMVRYLPNPEYQTLLIEKLIVGIIG